VNKPSLLRPEWELPAGVQAFVTIRVDGCSQGAYASFNLAEHVDDDAQSVQANRHLLLEQLGEQLCEKTGQRELALQWVEQVHGVDVLQATHPPTTPAPTADAIYTSATGLVCGVLTADCLPVLFATVDGSAIAVAHAGWRGLCNGVLEATVKQFQCAPSQITAWLGPAIAACHFEVGDEVRAAFLAKATTDNHRTTAAAFQPKEHAGKWQADLYALARIRLRALGLTAVSGDAQCTVCHADTFYSYRQQKITGRFATLIVKTA
jgi:polyphenol oxidase